MSADASSIRRIGILLPCATASFLLFYFAKPTLMLTAGTVLFVGLLLISFRWPETGTLVVLFSIYSNISVLAMRSASAIEDSAGSADRNPRIIVVLVMLALFLAIPLLYQMFVRKEPLIFDRGFALMLAFLTAGLASSLFTHDQGTLVNEIGDFLVEGVVLYFLLTNVIWDFSVLRRAIWALVLAGSLMAGFSIYQKLTHTETNNYGGFAQVDFAVPVGPEEQETMDRMRASGKVTAGGQAVGQVRLAGPIGGANEYGLILLVLLPLAAVQFRTESSRRWRALALVAAGLILTALVLTYSRGCMLAGIAVFGMMVWMRLLKPRHVLVSALGVGLLIGVLAPTIVTRMMTLGRLNSLFSNKISGDQAPDSSVVHRYVLDLAAWHVFLDHPIFGVGPGQFAKHYSSDYVNRIGLIEQRKNYLAHNTYLEKLAETGLLGSLFFLSILVAIMYGLWEQRKRLAQSRPELSLTATGFFLSLVVFAISSAFAHLAYQRYFWLLLALSSAATRILHNYSQTPAIDEPSFR